MKRGHFLTLAAMAIVLCGTANTARAQQCDIFTDVLASQADVCKAVQWLKNRGITTGCTATTYCPLNSVTRAQMALFMNRLGNAITPRLVSLQQGTGAGSNIAAGQNLPVCQTLASDLPAVNYPQQVRARGTVSGVLTGSAVGLSLLLSLNGAAPTSMVSQEMLITPSGDEVLHWSSNVVPVAPGNSISVAIAIFNRGAGMLNLAANGRCAIEVEAYNRNPTSAPFDQ
jgi:hypothetical protein